VKPSSSIDGTKSFPSPLPSSNSLLGTVLTSKFHLTSDYGESHYFYKTKGALPAGSEQWVDGFDHSGWGALLHFFIASYKSGKTIPTGIPDPSKDLFHDNLVHLASEKVVFWYRPHPKSAVATADPLPQPTSFSFADDNLHVVALLHSPGTIVIHSGSKSESYSAVEGFNEFILTGFQEGEQKVELVRNGEDVACGVGDVQISSVIDKYNFNAVVKRAVPGGCS
jgi:glucan endo-1,3-alpha-glucosidase